MVDLIKRGGKPAVAVGIADAEKRGFELVDAKEWAKQFFYWEHGTEDGRN